MINTESDRPIGYWLKKLHRLIDGQFERHLSEAGLSRRHWQLLTLVEDGPRSVPEIQTELEPFLPEVPDQLSNALSELVTRGWAESGDSIVSLTETGHAQFGLLKAKVAELRQASTAGVSPEEYQTTIDVLSRMAANLEPDSSAG